ncbi:MAG: hypothetical protein DSZ06_01105 [Sulfurospirillum sp.]|nr:MAG: hypothetical protein DSZ06_01105 [Sulfurospirillum sp.]
MRNITLFVLITFLYSGCAFKSLGDTVESIYTDTVVVKPSKANYKSAPAVSSKPILRYEGATQETPQEIAKKQTIRINKKGYIQSVSYEPDVNLYIYNFKTVPDNENLVFFYNKKLSYGNFDLIEVDIKDNFLTSVKQNSKPTTFKEPSLSQKIEKHKKRKRNYKIHEAIEEKINTL